jgi:hypothetical protein
LIPALVLKFRPGSHWVSSNGFLKKLGSWFQLVLVLKEIENPVPVPIPNPVPKTSPHFGSVFTNPNQNRQF